MGIYDVIKFDDLLTILRKEYMIYKRILNT